MNFSFLYEVVKLIIAGISVVCVAFYLLKPYLDNKEKFQLLELKKAAGAQTLPLRLQAYERIVLLIDRINPSNLLIRLNAPAHSAAELHSLIVAEVRNEFQHNVTQQIYISPRAWQIVKRIKDDTINLVNSAAQMQTEETSGLELGKSILNHLSQLETDPYDAALKLIRADLEELF
jgi:hypothetical protein